MQIVSRTRLAVKISAALLSTVLAVPAFSLPAFTPVRGSITTVTSQPVAPPLMFGDLHAARPKGRWLEWHSWIKPLADALMPDIAEPAYSVLQDGTVVINHWPNIRVGAEPHRAGLKTIEIQELGSGPIKVRVLTTLHEHEQAQTLAAKVYAELGYIKPIPKYDPHPDDEFSHRTRVLGMFNSHGEMVGTISVTRDRRRSWGVRWFSALADQLAEAAIVHAPLAKSWLAQNFWEAMKHWFRPGIPFEHREPQLAAFYRKKRQQGKTMLGIWRWTVAPGYRSHSSEMSVIVEIQKILDEWNLDGVAFECINENKHRAPAEEPSHITGQASTRRPMNHAKTYKKLGFVEVGAVTGLPAADFLGPTPPQGSLLMYGTRETIEKASRRVWKGRIREMSEFKAMSHELRGKRIRLKVYYGIPAMGSLWLITWLMTWMTSDNAQINVLGSLPYFVIFPGYLFMNAIFSEFFEMHSRFRDSIEVVAQSAVNLVFAVRMFLLTGSLGVVTLHFPRFAARMLDLGGLVNHHDLWTAVLNAVGISSLVQMAYRWHEARVWHRPNAAAIQGIQRFLFGLAFLLMAVGVYAAVAVKFFNDGTFYNIWCFVRNPIAGGVAAFLGVLLPHALRPAVPDHASPTAA